ncbi:hypothetical protein XA68_16547 [Ophiocordyceps unilateralis]|uniref:Uncharacterized protein n=1 Tax=Ophiocordyceps unilateralis TaxID=268505 RepID=A0A2A9P633_OPHUN|nr:hypothetical protein XA68_16547 [Ophiocordyceps unilateralis]
MPVDYHIYPPVRSATGLRLARTTSKCTSARNKLYSTGPTRKTRYDDGSWLPIRHCPPSGMVFGASAESEGLTVLGGHEEAIPRRDAAFGQER